VTRARTRTVFAARRGATVVLAILAAACALAEFLAPYPYDEQRNEHAFSPPTSIRFHDAAGWSARPFVHPFRMETDPRTYARRIVEDESRRVYLRFFARGAPYRLLGVFPADVHLFELGDAESGARVYLFGADALGRDLFARVLVGGRVSLVVGPYVLLLLIPLAALLGGLSGYCGGWIDFVLQRLGEVAVALPGLPVLLVVGAALAARHASPIVSLAAVLGALVAIGWGGMARVVRGQVLSIRQRDFILAARASGAGHVRILCRHVLPHVASYLAVSATLLVPGTMLMEASLSFLGLGVREPMTSWGALLAGARSLAAVERSPWLLIPGGFLAASVLAFACLGEASREAETGRASGRGSARRSRARAIPD
jgi:peptide/nickel transport system permease protein